MNDFAERVDQLSPLQRAVYALKETRSKLDKIQYKQTEPIAIIGMGCRFPGGANDPESFWQLLHDGIDAIREVPLERWNTDDYYDPNPETLGKTYVRQGGFLDVEIEKFDAEFFGLTPREVVSMDPQQRLLLEVSWEALENAGIAPNKLIGTPTGVFVGITANDYAQRTIFDDATQIDVYTATGNALNAAAGRLSYILGLLGPSIALDTACSSSLVAVHLACQSLREGDCNLALAGGVNLMLSAHLTIAMSKLRALAADGRCKTFDANADGYGRGEGGGMIVIKRLSDAIADGDQILALIRGSAINQDGRSSGLTVPNGLAQQKVIRTALANAQVKPAQINYVEAHGTGTSLGDPIEVKTLGTVLGEERSIEHPLMVGSVKTNIGHLEAAAGIAGLIKVVLAMQHQEISPHLHLKTLNPHIAAQKTPVVIPTQPTPWLVEEGERRLAGVSSFGFTGTNAHVVLEESLVSKSTSTRLERPAHILTLSAKNETSLKSLAGRFENYFAAHSSAFLGDICFTANTGRSHFSHRLALVADSLPSLCQKLHSFSLNQEQKTLSKEQTTKIAFLFSGQGSQYVNMGHQLYETQPTFRKTLERCDEILRPFLLQPLLSVLYPDSGTTSSLDETAYTQPALFALEYALAELWRSWGIEPTAVIGHSLGEYVAACVAGVFSLEDALKLIVKRSQLMQALPQNGEMVAVFADEAKVVTTIEPLRTKVSIAAINGPKNTVISGQHDAVQAVRLQLEAEGIEWRPLKVSHAFHSPLMEPMLEEFERVAKEIEYSTPQMGLISNLTGKFVEGKEVASASYWCYHIRETVKFSAGMQTLHEQGYELFVEIGPHPILIGMGQQCLPEGAGVWLPSLKKGNSDWPQMLQSLGQLYEHGVEVDWCEFDRDYQWHRLSLPTYPFDRQRYWIDAVKRQYPETAMSLKMGHPLLGKRLQSPLQQIQFVSQFNLDSLPLVPDHQLYGIPLVNFVIYLEMALAGAVEVFGKTTYVLEDVFISQALTLYNQENRPVELILNPEDSDRASFQIFSLTNSEADEQTAWTLHAFGKLRFEEIEMAPSTQDSTTFKDLQAQYQKEISSFEFYQIMRDRGADLGSSCQWLDRVWCGDKKAVGQIRLPKTVDENYDAYQLPLGVIDAGFQLLAASLPNEVDNYMLVALESFRCYGHSQQQLWGDAFVRLNDNHETITGNIRVLDETGKLVVEVVNAQLRQVSREAIQLNARTGKEANARPQVTRPRTKGSLSQEKLLAAEPKERQSILEIYLIEELARALQLPVSKLDPQQSLTPLVDSLITVELKNQIEADLQVVVPVTKFFEETSILQLANFILAHLTIESSTLSSDIEGIDDETLVHALEQLEGLSETEALAMLVSDNYN